MTTTSAPSSARNAAGFHHGAEAEIVCVVADEFPVPPDYGVHRTQFPGNGGKLIQIGNNVLFVRNGHINAVESTAFQEISDLIRLVFKKGVGIVPEETVNLGRIAVAQLSAQQAADHFITSA